MIMFYNSEKVNFKHYKSVFYLWNSSLGLITSRWIVFGNLACVIRYHCAVCAISTVSGEWLQDPCTQGYVNTVINLVVKQVANFR